MDAASTIISLVLALATPLMGGVLAGVDRILCLGGPWAIAALAYGTQTVPKVDKIVGPGNAYVTEAKRQVFGYCDIDMLAGPSEVAIIANKYANPEYVKRDLLAQSEHSMGLAILISVSKRLTKTMKKEVDKGFIVPAKNLAEAVDIANRIAPEHLQIMVRNTGKVLKGIRNAGAVVTDDIVRSLVVSQWMLDTREVMLIAHTRCGMMTFTDEELVARVKKGTGHAPPFAIGAFKDLEEHVRGGVRKLRSSPYLPHRDSIRGFIYDVETGRVREVAVR